MNTPFDEPVARGYRCPECGEENMFITKILVIGRMRHGIPTGLQVCSACGLRIDLDRIPQECLIF